MANYGPVGGGRTGPYWRRKLDITLPGERTGPELTALNLQRGKLGLPPLGGPAPLAAAAPIPRPVGIGGQQIMPGGVPGPQIDPRMIALLAAFHQQVGSTPRPARPSTAPPRMVMPVGTNPPRVPQAHPVLGMIPRPQIKPPASRPASHDALRQLVGHYQTRTARPAY